MTFSVSYKTTFTLAEIHIRSIDPTNPNNYSTNRGISVPFGAYTTISPDASFHINTTAVVYMTNIYKNIEIRCTNLYTTTTTVNLINTSNSDSGYIMTKLA